MSLTDMPSQPVPVIPTVTADHRSRIIAFATRPEAIAERDTWKRAGYSVRIVLRRGVHNVIVGEPPCLVCLEG